MKPLIFLLLSFFSMGLLAAETPPPPAKVLTLSDFLNQVQGGNNAYKSANESVKGSILRQDEANLLLIPSLSADINYINDAKAPVPPFFVYNRLITQNFNFGITQPTTFGLTAKLSYDINYFNYQGLVPFTPGAAALPGLYMGSPMIELTQNIWKNGFGAELRANYELADASNLANTFGQSFRTKQILSDAENTYWRLVFARQTLAVEQEALERAQKIFDYNQRQARLQLADKSDLLQAQAGLAARKLELQSALTEEKSAVLAFNATRGQKENTAVVSEGLETVKDDWYDKLKTPTREAMRDDVKAAEQNARIAAASAISNVERDSPTFDLFAKFALNSQDASVGSAFTDSFKTNRPTYVVGLKFSAVLAPVTAVHSREGWRLESDAAQLAYQQRLLEQEQDWTDLARSFQENKEKLVLARSIEAIQKEKADHERDRQKHGRTTTYQVLTFEQDFAQAQLTRIRTQSDLLKTYTRMKLYRAQYGAEQ